MSCLGMETGAEGSPGWPLSLPFVNWVDGSAFQPYRINGSKVLCFFELKKMHPILCACVRAGVYPAGEVLLWSLSKGGTENHISEWLALVTQGCMVVPGFCCVCQSWGSSSLLPKKTLSRKGLVRAFVFCHLTLGDSVKDCSVLNCVPQEDLWKFWPPELQNITLFGNSVIVNVIS